MLLNVSLGAVQLILEENDHEKPYTFNGETLKIV